jgi:hypothetical protein
MLRVLYNFTIFFLKVTLWKWITPFFYQNRPTLKRFAM